MDNALNKTGWIWFGVGYFLQIITQLSSVAIMSQSVNNIVVTTSFVAMVLFNVGCTACIVKGHRFCAQAKGRNASWGWLGLLHILMGPFNIISAIVIALLDDYAASIWHYRDDDKNIGPFSMGAIPELIKQGRISHDTPVWRVGKKEWLPASLALPDYFRTIPPPPPQIIASKTMPPLPTGAPAHTSAITSQTRNGLSIASLVCGIIGSVFSITSIPAVICGHMALIKIKNDPTKYGGKGMAIAGLILGYIAIVLGLILGTMRGILWAQLRQMGY